MNLLWYLYVQFCDFAPAVVRNWNVNLNRWIYPGLESCMAGAAKKRIKVLRLLATKLPMLSCLGKDFKPGSR